MTADSPSLDADLVGPLSPPRDNGEIVFGAPWERRVFGLDRGRMPVRAVRLGELSDSG